MEPVDWEALFERERSRVEDGEARLDPEQLVRIGNAAYGAGLESLPQIVVMNKVDLVQDRPSFPVSDARIVATFAVSCATGEGIDEFRRRLFALEARRRSRPAGSPGPGPSGTGASSRRTPRNR